MKITNFIKLLLSILVISFGISLPASASLDDISTKYSKLLSNAYRPEPNKVLAEFNNTFPEINPFLDFTEITLLDQDQGRNYGINDLAEIRISALKYVPQTIALLEAAYPNGTYIFLGRDVMLMADIIEAYYLSQGETGRVIRLHASGPTVHALQGEKGIQFLVSNGLDKRPDAPVVFIDNTSFGSNSQSRHILNLATQHRLDQGASQDQLANQLAVGTTYGGVDGSVSWHAEKFKNASDLENFKIQNNNTRALFITTPVHVITYFGFWNGSQTKEVITHEDGTQRGVISGEFSLGSKVIVLASMFEGMKSAMSPAFHEAVMQHEKILGIHRAPRTKSTLSQLTASAAALAFATPIKAAAELSPEEYVEANRSAIIGKAKEFILFHTAPNQKLISAQNIGLDKFIFEGMSTRDPQWETNYLDFISKSISRESKSNWGQLSLNTSYITAYFAGLRISKQPINIENLLNINLFLTENPAQKKYFSTNGLIIYSWLNEFFSSNSPVTTKNLINSAANIIDSAYTNKFLTKKDYRRLYLYLLSLLNPNDINQIREFGRWGMSSAESKQMLTEKAEVFLTSTRYDSLAKPVYLELIKQGFIKAPQNLELILTGADTEDCKDLLSQKNGE